MSRILPHLLVRAILAIALIFGGYGQIAKPAMAGGAVSAGTSGGFHCREDSTTPLPGHQGHGKDCFACQCCGEAPIGFVAPEAAFATFAHEISRTQQIEAASRHGFEFLDKAHPARASPSDA
jgi:hypothetical protein